MRVCIWSFPQTFNATDTVLKNVVNWPKITLVTFFETKLTFQIQHSIFRTKVRFFTLGKTFVWYYHTAIVFQIREGAKGIFEVLKWYNDINSFILDYISVSIKDSDVSDFYRYIIGFKNLLRSVEFSGKSGIYGMRYLTQGGILEREYMHEFIRFEMLRREYLNQTFNFMPAIKDEYFMMTEDVFFDRAQDLIVKKERYDRQAISK